MWKTTITAAVVLMLVGMAWGVWTARSEPKGTPRRNWTSLTTLIICVLVVWPWAAVQVERQPLLLCSAIIAGLAFGLLMKMELGAPSNQRANVLRELAEAIHLELSLPVFLSDLCRDCQGPIIISVQRLAMQLSVGAPIDAALSSTRLVPPHALAAIQSARKTGGAALVDALKDAAREVREGAKIQSRVNRAILYPAAIWLICLPVAWCVLLRGLTTIDYALSYRPWLEVNAWWQTWQYWAEAVLYLTTGILVLVVLWLTLRRIFHDACPGLLLSDLHAAVDVFHRWMPFFRTHWKHQCLARSARLLRNLIQAGEPLHEAAESVGNPQLSGAYASSFLALGHAIEKGEPLPAALRGTRFPDSMKWLALSGGEGGNLPRALEIVSEWHERKARRFECFIVRLLPVFTIPIVAAFVAAFYAPIFLALFEIVSRPVLR